MLKTKKITALICILLALILLSSNAVFADESSEDKPGEVFDSSDISEDKLYTMQRGEFTKEVTSGACSVAYLCIKELYFNTKEAKFIKYHVETGETVERGQVLASFNIPSSDSELTKRSLAIASQQEKMQSGLEKYDEKIALAQAELDSAVTDAEKELARLKLSRAFAEKKLYQHEQNYVLDNLKSELADLREEYSKNVITAPFDGVIRSLALVQEGENVAGIPLITIADPDSRVILANNTTGAIQYNQDVSISYGKGNVKATGDGTVISSNTLFADTAGLSLNSVLKIPSDRNVLLIGLKEREMVDKIASAMTSSLRCDNIRLSNVWLIPKELTQKDDKFYYVETLSGTSYRKTYFYAGGENNKYVWMIEGIDENAKIIIR